MYQGQYFQVTERGQFAELIFNAKADGVNTLSKKALEELQVSIELIKNTQTRGLIIRSGKALFSAGADVKAFRKLFKEGDSAVLEYLEWVHGIYNSIEDLSMPKVAIINGVAAGGGVELSLLAEYRLATIDAKISLPEVKLGIMPGWGGMTRLPRITGVDTALQWLTTGKNFRADKALEHHVVDGVIAKDVDSIAQAEALLQSCIDGDIDWLQRQKEKQVPLLLSDYELAMSINVARGMVAKVAGKHYPAPAIMLDTIEKAAKLSRDEALAIERRGIAKCVNTGVADALVSVFLSDMAVKAKTKSIIKGAVPVTEVGVIGAGIMGGGIAYVTADKGADVVMKDINKAGLALGLTEANKLLAAQVERGRKKPLAMGETLNRIQSTLYNQPLTSNDLIIEAVVENPKIKEAVLAELEQVSPNATLASNTSTLMISGLAQALKKPENFCGIHFFNPVHKMPLVEVIRGEQTSDQTITQAVKYVSQLGKTPIVVNDCAGFLVNRCLTPYFHAFNQLVVDGGDIPTIDKVMSKGFGWPMGPAYLLDVIGLDTAAHCIDVMDLAFPERMSKPANNVIQAFVDLQQYGQKNSLGFYAYQPDRKGRLKPSVNADATQLIASKREAVKDFDHDTITMRMMLPMMFEAIRCLDEGVVASPAEADIAMIYGTGFPPFRGGLFYYMDQLGLDKLLEIAEQYKHLGTLYEAPKGLLDRVQNNQKFYA
ncbi:fatty acid oxidation complex subunit alpha FadB [Photobacterium profundum]|uniref:enoyl-CoA hydratase n=1 Tax=Photobacterium profundum 3TCK TaxID=314280 RepID=Q1Z537_9GAMM|nr:fatty acid oxidation complex subunit alpha FadB [Photobacterium profundum]EAS43729.1 3-hydroxyacyl-CoA dehydrogenase [Photobacterium profundum 3TCK]PSV64097.1 fatty acid oxidation complex subunit alpha FadB [Photobacterium profundum]